MTSRDEIQAIVYACVAETFDFPEGDLKAEMNAGDIQGWDSISTSYLMLAIEERMDRELPIESIMEADNLGEMIDLIHKDVSDGN